MTSPKPTEHSLRTDRPALLEVAKHAPIVLAGSLGYVVLVFLLNLLIIRYATESEFGLYSLCLAFVNILAALSGLGFPQALPGYISHQLGKRLYSKAWGSVVCSFVATTLVSLSLSCLLFLTAESVSGVLGKPELTDAIKRVAFAVPLIALVNLLVCHLRAVKNVGGKVYFRDLLQPLSGVALLAIVVLGKFSFKWVLWSYPASFLITLICLLVYAGRTIPKFIPTDQYRSVTKEVLLFSLPLLGTGVLALILNWTDTLFLGYFQTSRVVGLYNGALRLGRLISIVLTSAGFIYLPIASRLYSEKGAESVGKLYESVTKWVFFLTLPLFLHMFFMPDAMLRVLFRAKYVAAAPALQFLAVGFFSHVLFGLNAMTSVSIGKPRINLASLSAALVINAILDIVLIPEYGLAGAAIASCVSLAISNAILTALVFRHSRIHPFSRSYLRMIAFAIGLVVVIFLVPVRGYLNTNLLFFVFLLIVCLGGLTVCRVVTEDDALVLRLIERKLTGNTRIMDKFQRFVGGE